MSKATWSEVKVMPRSKADRAKLETALQMSAEWMRGCFAEVTATSFGPATNGIAATLSYVSFNEDAEEPFSDTVYAYRNGDVFLALPANYESEEAEFQATDGKWYYSDKQSNIVESDF